MSLKLKLNRFEKDKLKRRWSCVAHGMDHQKWLILEESEDSKGITKGQVRIEIEDPEQIFQHSSSS